MSLNLKPVPDQILDAAALVPPNRGYAYFEAGVVAGKNFPYQSRAFLLTAASWLADAALLAYAEPAFATAQFAAAGSVRTQFFSGTSTQAYAAVFGPYALVAFRGTEIRDPVDFTFDSIMDARFVLTGWTRDGTPGSAPGLVHSGFHVALDEIWAGLRAFLEQIRLEMNPPRSLWFTGHSLGAALATLAAARYGQADGLYTFGSPRVGDPNFAGAFAVPTAFRVVNNNDAVARVPPPNLGYRHVGQPCSIDSGGDVHVPGQLSRPGDSIQGNAIDLLGAIRLNLFDHAPIYYATHLWNAFARQQNANPGGTV